jgi:hypothetical protein
MTDVDPLSELFTLIAAPIAGTIRSVEQFRKGVDEFLKGVENFNRTMDNLNQTAERMNGLLEEVEEPLRAAIPQVTRTVKTADQMMQVVSGPAMAVAPSLELLARTLSNPEFEQFPRQIAQFTEVLGELSSRLAPLAQLAGNAGGLFGGLRIPGFSAPGVPEGRAAPTGSPRPGSGAQNDESPADPDPGVETPVAEAVDGGERWSRDSGEPDTEESSPAKPSTKKPATKRTATKRTASKKPATKTAGAKKTSVKKTSVKKTSVKKSTAKKPAKSASASTKGDSEDS